MKVLRDVVLHELPHDLARPRKTVPHAPERERPVVAAVVAAPSPEQVLAAKFEDGFNAGLRQAAAQADSQLAAAQAAAQAAGEEGRRSGFEQGYAQGLQQAREKVSEELRQLRAQAQEESQAALSDKLQALGQLMESLKQRNQQLVASAEDDLVALAHEAICRILGQRAAAPEVVANMVRLLLAQHERSAKVKIHVHPMDAEALREVQVAGCDWVADENVQLGGVLLRSSQGDLDARLEVQLEELRRTLRRVRGEHRAAQRAGTEEAKP